LKETLLALGTGSVVGVLFAVFRLPVPAPPTLAGVAGIVGIFVGYLVASKMGWSIR
jgi:XapX domain-containing protein